MATPKQKKDATQERGYASSSNATGAWWLVDLHDLEQSPELRWPECLPIYDAMRRQDAQVGSVLRAVTHPVRRTGWSIDPNGARPEVAQMVADDLGLPIRGVERPVGRLRDRFSWADHLRHALLMLVFGAMYFEQVYRIDPATGLARLRKLGPRMPRSIKQINVASDGGLVSIEQYPTGQGNKIVLPVERLVCYVNEREAGNWAGMSLLRQAYKNWLIKDRLLRTQAQSVDRNGMGIPVYTGGETGTDEDKQEAELDFGAEIAQSIRAGDNSGAAIPKDAKLELMGVSGTIPDAEKPIRYHDEQIARAVLAHFLNLGTQTGSWALGSTFADFFNQSLQAVAQDIADVTTAHVIEDMVDLNWGPDEPAPRLVFEEIGSQTLAIAQAIKMLVDAGVITADEGLEAHIRLGLKLPAKDDDTDPSPEGEAA